MKAHISIYFKADFGSFDQCVQSQFKSSNLLNDENFNGQFCMLSIRTNEHDVLVKQNPYLYNKTMNDLTIKNREWYKYNLGNIIAVCIPGKVYFLTIFSQFLIFSKF